MALVLQLLRMFLSFFIESRIVNFIFLTSSLSIFYAFVELSCDKSYLRGSKVRRYSNSYDCKSHLIFPWVLKPEQFWHCFWSSLVMLNFCNFF